MRDLSLSDLGRTVVQEAVARSGLSGEDVHELAFGVNFPGSDRSVARQVALKAEIPDDRPAYTVDRACCSSLAAITLASRSLRLGEAEVAVAGGAENLSKVPFFLEDVRWGHRLGDITLADKLIISCPHTHVPRAVQASDEAIQHQVYRDEQDRWAVRSHERALLAEQKGYFDAERVAIDVMDERGESHTIARDEAPRPDATLSRLSRLPTVYGSQTVTAGNAPGLSTGASAVVLATRKVAQARGLPTLGTLLSSVQVCGPPARIASIPAVAAQEALRVANLALDDIDLVEINEAFAAVPLVSTLILADGDRAKAERLRERTNINGGAIALGHPTGATAARLIITAAHELQRRGGGHALIAICGGVGEAAGAVLRVPAPNHRDEAGARRR
jgi:acetyl-CoA C-acetyltransferase